MLARVDVYPRGSLFLILPVDIHQIITRNSQYCILQIVHLLVLVSECPRVVRIERVKDKVGDHRVVLLEYRSIDIAVVCRVGKRPFVGRLLALGNIENISQPHGQNFIAVNRTVPNVSPVTVEAVTLNARRVTVPGVEAKALNDIPMDASDGSPSITVSLSARLENGDV